MAEQAKSVLAQRLEKELRDAIEVGENHDSDNPDPPPSAEHDCFCVRCCAIRFLDAHNASVLAQEAGDCLEEVYRTLTEPLTEPFWREKLHSKVGRLLGKQPVKYGE